MAYVDDAALRNDMNFQNRIRMAMIKAAIAIGNEPKSSDAVIDGKRNVLSVNVLNRPDAYVPIFTSAAIEAGTGVSNPLTSGSLDVDLDTAIASVWNAIAGITSRD